MAVSDLTWGTSVIESKKLDLGSWVKAQYSVSKPSIQTKAQYSGGSRPNQNRNLDIYGTAAKSPLRPDRLSPPMWNRYVQQVPLVLGSTTPSAQSRMSPTPID